MWQLSVGLGAILSVLTLAACGADPAVETRSAGDVARPAGSQRSAGARVRACDLLDLETASRVIGSGTEHPGGDTEEGVCIYSNPGVAMLTLRLDRAELYDEVTIMQPHMSVQIGRHGRYNVQDTGVAAVQFAQGDYSVTLSVQPIGRSQTEYLEPLLTAAREAAGHLP